MPPALIAEPWTAKPNRAEKYLGVAPAAARLGQNDSATLAALVARLGRAGDPRWLTGDMIGALSDLTGRRFGYDLDAWRSWWQESQATPYLIK